MKVNTILILKIAVILCLAGCAVNRTGSAQWEGISDNILKVTISEFFPIEENTTNDIIQVHLKDKLNQRASLLLASHFSINLDRNKISRETDITLNNLINETIIYGKLLNYECSENNYCTANGEYNITDLQKTLERINIQ